MANTYDLDTEAGKVRLLITDTDIENAIFNDDEIDTFLSLTAYESDNEIRLAAAMALETIASSEVLVQKKIWLMDLKTDGPACSKELRARAKDLREQVDSEEVFDWVEWGLTDFNKREILLKDALRNG